MTQRISAFLTGSCCSSFSGFDKAKLETMETYLKAVKLLRSDQSDAGGPEYSQVRAQWPARRWVCVLHRPVRRGAPALGPTGCATRRVLWPLFSACCSLTRADSHRPRGVGRGHVPSCQLSERVQERGERSVPGCRCSDFTSVIRGPAVISLISFTWICATELCSILSSLICCYCFC